LKQKKKSKTKRIGIGTSQCGSLVIRNGRLTLADWMFYNDGGRYNSTKERHNDMVLKTRWKVVFALTGCKIQHKWRRQINEANSCSKFTWTMDIKIVWMCTRL